jgi:hypothetical protein
MGVNVSAARGAGIGAGAGDVPRLEISRGPSLAMRATNSVRKGTLKVRCAGWVRRGEAVRASRERQRRPHAHRKRTHLGGVDEGLALEGGLLELLVEAEAPLEGDPADLREVVVAVEGEEEDEVEPHRARLAGEHALELVDHHVHRDARVHPARLWDELDEVHRRPQRQALQDHVGVAADHGHGVAVPGRRERLSG